MRPISSEERPLHVQVAEAIGWIDCRETQTLCQVKIDGEWETPVRSFGWEGRPPTKGPPCTWRSIPHFPEDWAATGPLIERLMRDWDFRLLHHYEDQPGDGCLAGVGWVDGPPKYYGLAGPGEPLIAVCNLILKLGKEGKLDAAKE